MFLKIKFLIYLLIFTTALHAQTSKNYPLFIYGANIGGGLIIENDDFPNDFLQKYDANFPPTNLGFDFVLMTFIARNIYHEFAIGIAVDLRWSQTFIHGSGYSKQNYVRTEINFNDVNSILAFDPMFIFRFMDNLPFSFYIALGPSIDLYIDNISNTPTYKLKSMDAGFITEVGFNIRLNSFLNFGFVTYLDFTKLTSIDSSGKFASDNLTNVIVSNERVGINITMGYYYYHYLSKQSKRRNIAKKG